MVQQRLAKRYVNRQKLSRFLVTHFGTNGYSVEVRMDLFELRAPANITYTGKIRRLYPNSATRTH